MVAYPELRDLQLLIALSQRKHFTQAAADCGISQPAFSARIRHLEVELGVPIVRRGNKFLGFTPDGERVLTWASKLLTDAEGLRQDIEIGKGSLRGQLVLGVVPTALTFAADVSTRLRQTHPNLTITLKSLTSARIVRELMEYALDAGITYASESIPETVAFEPIYDEQYVLLAPRKMAPRSKGHATWKEAAALPLCLLTQDMHFRQIVDEVFAAKEYPLNPVMETNAFTAVLAQVANGAAATIAPAKLAGSLLINAQTVCLPLKMPAVSHAIGLAVILHEPRLPAIDALRLALDFHDN